MDLNESVEYGIRNKKLRKKTMTPVEGIAALTLCKANENG